MRQGGTGIRALPASIMETDGGLKGLEVAEAASGLLHPDHGIGWREPIHWYAYAEQRGTCRLTAEGERP